MSLSADLSCLQGSRGAEREAALTTLEKQLTCPICLEIFSKPVVILPCEHNLCRKCANELYQPSLFHARTTMSVNSGRFRCPSCRQEVVLDRHGVYGLQRNLLVENIIDIYKEEINSTRPLPPPSPPPPAHSTCSDHEGEKVNIYCLTCQVPTCSLCKVFGAHQSCEVAPLSAIYQQQKDQLSEGVASLRAFSDTVQTLIHELEETCRHIEENCSIQKQSVCEKFNRMFSILEERQKAMTQRISSEQEAKTGHARALVRCHDDSMAANSRLAESAASSMEEPNMAAFVQSSAETITKVKAASASGSSETLRPGYERLSRYRFNFSEQERALKSIDFIKVVKDVPEEPQLDPEPKEPKDSLIQNTEPNGNQQAAEEASEQETPELDSGHIPEGEEEAAAELAKEGGERQEEMSTQQCEAMDEEEEEDADFYPGWCTAGLSPSAPGQTLTEVHRCTSEDGFASRCWGQIQLQPPQILDSLLLSGRESTPPPRFNEEEEVQGWAYLNEAEGKGSKGCSSLLPADLSELRVRLRRSEEGEAVRKEKRHMESRDGEFGASKGREDDEKKPKGSDVTVETRGAEDARSQAVTLFFYLLALLVILQRAWAYVGCFICT